MLAEGSVREGSYLETAESMPPPPTDDPDTSVRGARTGPRHTSHSSHSIGHATPAYPTTRTAATVPDLPTCEEGGEAEGEGATCAAADVDAEADAYAEAAAQDHAYWQYTLPHESARFVLAYVQKHSARYASLQEVRQYIARAHPEAVPSAEAVR